MSQRSRRAAVVFVCAILFATLLQAGTLQLFAAPQFQYWGHWTANTAEVCNVTVRVQNRTLVAQPLTLDFSAVAVDGTMVGRIVKTTMAGGQLREITFTLPKPVAGPQFLKLLRK